jgi:hypothetical protein
LSRKKLYLAAFVLHFLLVFAVSSREIFWVLARGLTIVPATSKPSWQKAEDVSSAALGQSMAPSNPVRRGLATYLNLAGIEAGYGFFAPNVSDSCKLVFELQYPDGRVEDEVPAVNSEASGLRVATLLDKIARPRYAPLREVMVRMLTESIWREHSDAAIIRAVFGTVKLPSIADFEQGVRESNEFLYAYEFDFRESDSKEQNP